MPHKNYKPFSLEQSVTSEVIQIRERCKGFSGIIKLVAAKDAAMWWAIQNWQTKDSNLLFLGWFIFLISTFAYSWAYSRLILAVIINPLRPDFARGDS